MSWVGAEDGTLVGRSPLANLDAVPALPGLTAMTPSRSVAGCTANLFAHSLIPIVVGYIVAHYLSYGIEIGQQTLARLSDPMVDGSDLLGTADLQVSYWPTQHPTFLAPVKVTAIVAGHVLGVIAAHDRALEVLPPHRQPMAQLPLLVVMIVFSVSDLYLLLSI